LARETQRRQGYNKFTIVNVIRCGPLATLLVYVGELQTLTGRLLVLSAALATT
jgi:hypothetical protein